MIPAVILVAFIVGLVIGAGVTYWLIAFHVTSEECSLMPVADTDGFLDDPFVALVSDAADTKTLVVRGLDTAVNGHALAPMSDLELRTKDGNR